MVRGSILVALVLSAQAGGDSFYDQPQLQVNGTTVALGQAPAFGVGTDGVKGSLFSLPPNNKDGCRPIVDVPEGSWIALVSRGNCRFVTKVRNVQAANGSAVIIYDNSEHEDAVPIMCSEDGDDSDITIPSIAVSHDEGPKLRKLGRVEITLTAFTPFPKARCNPYFPFKWTALTVVVISGAMLALCMGALMAAVRRRRSFGVFEPLAESMLGPPAIATMTSSAVDGLPSKIYVPPEEGVASSECASAVATTDSGEMAYREEQHCPICLEDFQKGQKQRLLPCSHVFHATCVDEWLTTRRSVCPICKQDPTSDTTTSSPNSRNNSTTDSSPTVVATLASHLCENSDSGETGAVDSEHGLMLTNPLAETAIPTDSDSPRQVAAVAPVEEPSPRNAGEVALTISIHPDHSSELVDMVESSEVTTL